MNTSRKRTAMDELERIEDALVDSILHATGEELRDEIAESTDDADACIASVEESVAAAISKIAKARLADAQAELALWRTKSGNVSALDREKARAKLQQIRGSDREFDSKMMLAARKGEELSDSDLEGLLEDLAELERLEPEDGDE